MFYPQSIYCWEKLIKKAYASTIGLFVKKLRQENEFIGYESDEAVGFSADRRKG